MVRGLSTTILYKDKLLTPSTEGKPGGLGKQ